MTALVASAYVSRDEREPWRLVVVRALGLEDWGGSRV